MPFAYAAVRLLNVVNRLFLIDLPKNILDPNIPISSLFCLRRAVVWHPLSLLTESSLFIMVDCFDVAGVLVLWGWYVDICALIFDISRDSEIYCPLFIIPLEINST